jgi:hypothetical protein
MSDSITQEAVSLALAWNDEFQESRGQIVMPTVKPLGRLQHKYEVPSEAVARILAAEVRRLREFKDHDTEAAKAAGFDSITAAITSGCEWKRIKNMPHIGDDLD